MYKVVSLFCGCGGADCGILGGFNFNGKYYLTVSNHVSSLISGAVTRLVAFTSIYFTNSAKSPFSATTD